MMNSYSVFYANYSIGTDVYELVPAICAPCGSRVFIIGGEKALAAALPALQPVLDSSALTVLDTQLFGENCTYSDMDRLAALAKEQGAEMIFGIGGGKALDTAKGAANRAGIPVFTFPTIAATCAATSALSVVYREDGRFEEFAFFDRPAQHCFINTDIIAHAPAKYLRAGMCDTIGKYFECHFAARGDKLNHSAALGREISNLCYFPLLEHGEQAMIDCHAEHAGESLEQAVLAIIVSTGLVSLLVPDEYNCAIAHSVYYGLVLLPGFEEKNLHGDVVAYGVLVQLAVDHDWDEFRRLHDFLLRLKLPVTLAEMNVPLDRTALHAMLHETVTGPDMDHIPYPVTEDMIFTALEQTEHYKKGESNL